jgi:heme exporter protein D
MGQNTLGVEMNWQEFFAMGGYAFYVWTSYFCAFIILAVNVIVPVIQRKRFMRQQLLRLRRREQQ